MIQRDSSALDLTVSHVLREPRQRMTFGFRGHKSTQDLSTGSSSPNYIQDLK